MIKKLFKKNDSAAVKGNETESLLKILVNAGYEVRISQDLSDNFKVYVWVVDLEPYTEEKNDAFFRGLLGDSLNVVLIEACNWLA